MPDPNDHDRIVKLEAQVATVLTLEPRITKLERALWITLGAAGAAALGSGSALVTLLGGH